MPNGFMARWCNALNIILLLVCCCFILTLFLTSQLPEVDRRRRVASNDTYLLFLRLQRAMERESGLQQKVDELQAQLQRLGVGCNCTSSARPPAVSPSSPFAFFKSPLSSQQEEHFKRLWQELVELGYMVRGAYKNRILTDKKFLGLFTEQHRELLAQTLRFGAAEGREQWKRLALKLLSETVQRKLWELQNPKDCRRAKKLVCDLNKSCGFGCQLHHVVFCFQVAFFTGRTLILNDKPWSYSHHGWTSVFQPLSDSCLSTYDAAPEAFSAATADSLVVSLGIIDFVDRDFLVKMLPLNYPDELAEILEPLHFNPPAWWIGQLVAYLMRYNNSFGVKLDALYKAYNISGPIVGIHVRRTDKLEAEASFHPIEEYMQEVDSWYELHLTKNANFLQPNQLRQVYIATDDQSVFTSAAEKFPQYRFLGNDVSARDAAVSSRYSDRSLRGVVMDIHFLSICDYLVCTFSSQICRVAYEKQQHVKSDDGSHAYSLDDIYYFGGQTRHYYKAVIEHVAEGSKEMSLKPGDLISIAGNHLDGYSLGVNERTRQKGLYPSYKAIDMFQRQKLPLKWSDELKAAVRFKMSNVTIS